MPVPTAAVLAIDGMVDDAIGIAVVSAPPTPVTSAACSATAPVRVLKLATPVVLDVTALVTNAVVAIAVVLLPGGWVTPLVPVGSVGVPVNVGEEIGAPPAPVTSLKVSVTAPVRVLNDDTPADPLPVVPE
jgi:hypothetical protein